MWSLDVGEAIVIDKLRQKRKDLEIFIPTKDKAVDLIAIKKLDNPQERKIISIQVKESRQYPDKKFWCEINSKYLEMEYRRVDYYIFVLFNIVQGDTKPVFEESFLIVPTNEILERLEGKRKKVSKKTSTETYDFYFRIDEDVIKENRDKKEFYYSKFLNKWDILK